MPPKASYKEVGTKDSVAYMPKFNKSASKWTKSDLDLLGVDYQYNAADKIELERVNIPDELSQGHSPMNETDI
jgi:hypothetical protein